MKTLKKNLKLQTTLNAFHNCICSCAPGSYEDFKVCQFEDFDNHY